MFKYKSIFYYLGGWDWDWDCCYFDNIFVFVFTLCAFEVNNIKMSVYNTIYTILLQEKDE